MIRTKVISSVTSDLVTDQRIHRISTSLRKIGFEVMVIGRQKKNSGLLDSRNYECYRMKLPFEKGPLFYFFFNLRLFIHLMKSEFDILLSNDLDSLPANAAASFLRQKVLFYDSHEYFTEVPELEKRPFVKLIWKTIEWLCIKRVKKAFTVSPAIAREYHLKYGIEFEVIRNFPRSADFPDAVSYKVPDLRKGKSLRLLLYQGSVNVARGLEEMILAMEFLPGFHLCILGEGDILQQLKALVEQLSWQDRISFHGRIPLSELPAYTRQADLGLSLEKKVGLSYTYALPNKVFDYVREGIPVLMSDLPELQQLNDTYHFGIVSNSHEAHVLSTLIKDFFNQPELIEELKTNCHKAAKNLNWEKEEEKVRQIFSPYYNPSL